MFFFQGDKSDNSVCFSVFTLQFLLFARFRLWPRERTSFSGYYCFRSGCTLWVLSRAHCGCAAGPPESGIYPSAVNTQVYNKQIHYGT